jgi:hypothetical protein
MRVPKRKMSKKQSQKAIKRLCGFFQGYSNILDKQRKKRKEMILN